MKSRSPKPLLNSQHRVAVRRYALRASATLSVLAMFVASACSLDLSSKTACETDTDCLSGYACSARTCTPWGALQAGQGSGAGSAGESEFEPGFGGFGGSGGAHALAGAPAVGGAGLGGAGLGGAPEQDGGVAVPATLRSLAVSAGSLRPAFDPDVHTYVLDLPLMVSAFRFTATTESDASITLDGTPLASGEASQLVELDALGGVFQFDVTCAGRATQYTVQARRGAAVPHSALVKSSDASLYGPFGTSVALDQDTLAVGSVESVDIYRRVADSWAHEAHLKPRDADFDDDFGTSLALSGDTLVVGALLEDSSASGTDGDRLDNSAPMSGAAYVFTRSDNVWTERSYLKASNPGTGAVFGACVAVLGDRIAVGAPSESGSATGVNGVQDDATWGSGAVYLFARSGDTWLQQAYIKASNTKDHAMFGSSVALTAHGLAVGAQNEQSSGRGVDADQESRDAMGSGAVYLFSESGGVWAQEAFIKASNTDVNDAFGVSVAFDGSTLVVGAPREDGSGPSLNPDPNDNGSLDSGAVYLFSRVRTAWQQIAYLKPTWVSDGELFGWSVGLSEQTVAVGAWAESRHDGTAYLFAPDGASFSQRAALNASIVRGVGFKSESPDGFGWSLALAPNTLVVGAPNEGRPIATTPHGTSYLFE